jgi:plastocyanin
MTSRTRLRRVWLGLLGAAALGATGYAIAATATVELTSKGPQPPAVTVAWGDTVTFHNADAIPMTISSGETDFSSPPIPPGGSYEKIFDAKVGNHPYRVTMPKEKGGTVETHGSVVVKLSARLTLAATPQSVIYGQTATLQGTTTLSDRPVTLQQKTTIDGEVDWADVGQVTPNTDGAFAFVVQPRQKTLYRAAQANEQLKTTARTVTVAPRVTMRVPSRTATTGTPLVVTARVQPASATSAVLLLRSATPGHWTQAAKSKVRKDGSANLTRRMLPGTALLRAVVKPPFLHTGFTAAQSADVRVLGVNPPTTLKFEVRARPILHTKAKYVQTAPDRFSAHLLRADPSKVTLVMRNLGRTRHGLALSGPGVHVKGPVVGHGRTSKVTAFLKAGRYSFYCYVPGDRSRGESGTLIVAQR